MGEKIEEGVDQERKIRMSSPSSSTSLLRLWIKDSASVNNCKPKTLSLPIKTPTLQAKYHHRQTHPPSTVKVLKRSNGWRHETGGEQELDGGEKAFNSRNQVSFLERCMVGVISYNYDFTNFIKCWCRCW